jgi:hypothetical protein
MCLVPAALGCSGPEPLDETRNGELTAEDARHPSDGSFYDEHTFEAGEGYRIRVSMESGELDTFLHLSGPDGNWQNDDRSGDDRGSVIDCIASASGTYRILANSHEAGEVGRYVLRIRTDRPVDP